MPCLWPLHYSQYDFVTLPSPAVESGDPVDSSSVSSVRLFKSGDPVDSSSVSSVRLFKSACPLTLMSAPEGSANTAHHRRKRKREPPSERYQIAFIVAPTIFKQLNRKIDSDFIQLAEESYNVKDCYFFFLTCGSLLWMDHSHSRMVSGVVICTNYPNLLKDVLITECLHWSCILLLFDALALEVKRMKMRKWSYSKLQSTPNLF